MKPRLPLLCALLLVSILTYGQTQIGSDIIGEELGDCSGCSVALSSDGSIIAIGAYINTQPDPILSGQGHVRVYENVNGVWTQLGGDIDGETVGDQSGYSVSLSSDGSILAIGAPSNNGNDPPFSGNGQVRVYEYDSGSWILLGGDIDGQVDDGLGTSVALSSDGTILATGGVYNDELASQSGVTRIYEYDDIAGAWFQLGGNIYGEGADDYSGRSVSISSDGSIVAIGSSFNDGSNGVNSGHVRVYEYNTTTNGWIQLGSDIDGESANDGSGFSVSLSSNGNVVAIGSYLNGDNGSFSGHVRVFQYNSGLWSQIGANIVGEAAGDQSGRSVALSSDGNIVAIGAYVNNGAGDNSGHVRVFENISGTWTQIGDDMDGKSSYDYLGRSVAISDDGSIVAGGASGDATSFGYVSVYSVGEFLNTSELNITDAIGIYPTVVSNKFTVTTEDNTFISLILYNSLGKEIIKSIEKQVDISGFTSGLYYVSVNTIQGIIVKKIIKK